MTVAKGGGVYRVMMQMGNIEPTVISWGPSLEGGYEKVKDEGKVCECYYSSEDRRRWLQRPGRLEGSVNVFSS